MRWLPFGSEYQAGKLDRAIIIQEYTSSQDADIGTHKKDWTTWAAVWASKTEGGGREFHQARQISAELTTMWQIRYLAGLSVKMRIVDDAGIIYEIIRIEEVGRQDRWNIWTKARRT